MLVPNEFERNITGFAKLIKTELNKYAQHKNLSISYGCNSRTDEGAIIACEVEGTRGYSDIFPFFIDPDTQRLTSYPKLHMTLRHLMPKVELQWIFPAIEVHWKEYNKTVKMANKYKDILKLEYGPNFDTPLSGYETYNDCMVIWDRGIMTPENTKWRNDRITMLQILLFLSYFCSGWITIKITQKCYLFVIGSCHKWNGFACVHNDKKPCYSQFEKHSV